MKAKNIFYVHNHIATLITLGIIDNLNYVRENCLIIYSYVPKLDYKDIKTLNSKSLTITYPNMPRMIFVQQQINKVKQRIQDLLETEIDSEFHLFTSSFLPFFVFELINHTNCRSYNIIEDGSSAYLSKEERFALLRQKFKSKFRLYTAKVALYHQLKFRLNADLIISYYESATCHYGSSDNSYKDSQQRKTITLQQRDDMLDSDIDHILVLTYIVESRFISIKKFTVILHQIILNLIQQGIIRLHFKFHPQQILNGKYIEKYRTVFASYKDQIEIIELDQKTSLEELAIQEGKSFIFSISSVALYAARYDNSMISYYDMIVASEPSFRNIKLSEDLESVIRSAQQLKPVDV